MSCIKQWVYKEPLIEYWIEEIFIFLNELFYNSYMDRGTINGDIVKLIEFDLETIKKNELDFVASF